MRVTIVSTLLVALLAVPVGGAFAATSASADLDLSGLSFTFLSGTGSLGAYQWGNASAYAYLGSGNGLKSGQSGGYTASAAWEGITASSSIDLNGGVASKAAAAYAVGENTSNHGSASTGISRELTLDPGAMVEITVPYALKATAASSNDYAWASVGQTLSRYDSVSGGWRSWTESASISSWAWGQQSSSQNGMLDLIYRNNSNVAQSLSWSGTTSAQATATTVLVGGVTVTMPILDPGPGGITVWGPGVAAVPEPEAYAMFMAGLGLVGFMIGRRKQRV